MTRREVERLFGQKYSLRAVVRRGAEVERLERERLAEVEHHARQPYVFRSERVERAARAPQPEWLGGVL